MKLAALALALLALAAAPASAGAVSERHFQTPSHRIACMMFHAYVRCDTFFENDTAYYVPRTGKGRAIHVTDTVSVPGERELAYGHSIHFGVFTCLSRATGLRCENRRHHGFFISVERQQFY